ncbi:MAG: DMT family transporter [Bacteroidales bacterium]
MSLSNNTKAYLFAIASVLCWSTIASAFNLTLKYVDFANIVLYSSFLATLLFGFVLLLRKQKRPAARLPFRAHFQGAVRGFLNPFLYYLVLLKAYSLLKAQEAGTLNYIWPVTLVLLSVPLLKQKIGWKNIGAILISFFGLVIISTEGNIAELEFSDPFGVLLAAGSSVFWALFWILNMKDKSDPVEKMFLNFLYGTLFTALYLGITGRITVPDSHGLLGIGYIAVFEMALTYLLWLRALGHAGTTAQVSNLIYLSPFISLGIIRWVVGEKILASTVVGLVFIVGGIVIQQSLSRRRSRIKSTGD